MLRKYFECYNYKQHFATANQIVSFRHFSANVKIKKQNYTTMVYVGRETDHV